MRGFKLDWFAMADLAAEAEDGDAPRRVVAPGKRTLTAQLKPRPGARRTSMALAAGGAGAPLPAAIASVAAAVLGQDLAGVRVHVDGQAEALGARAFAAGDGLYFAAGAYQPETADGVALIGHELSHVVQQRGGRVVAEAPAGELAIHTDAGLEAEADRAGDALARSVAVGQPIDTAAAPTAVATVATAAIQGWGLPFPIVLPGCGPTPSDVPADDAAALDRWRKGHARFLRLYNAGLGHVPPANEVEPSRATLFRNACEWIRDGEVRLVLVSLAAAPRQSAANDRYFDDHHVFPSTTPNPAAVSADHGQTWGSCDGTTMWLVDLMHPDWTDDLIKDTLIHEIQHDAGDGPGDQFNQDPAAAEAYQSEFRARWIEPEANADYGDPANPAPGGPVTWTDPNGATQTRQMTGFGNERQQGIFKVQADDPDVYDVAMHYFTDPAYRAMVHAFVDPVGGNLIDSVRIHALSEQIVARQPPVDILTAATALDATDCHYLTNRAVAADFWDTAQRELVATPALITQLGDVVDHPAGYGVHVVVAGDTLSIIAGNLLGDIARWPEIYNLAGNQAAVGADPDAIAPGLTLLVPPR